MKVTIERDSLDKATAKVVRVVERRNTIPILGNVRIEAKDGSLSLTATDLDIEMTDRLPANVGKPGSVTVPALILRDIVRKLPPGAEIALELADKGDVTVRCGRSRFTLRTLPVSDFPDLAQGEMVASFQIAPADLAGLIRKTAFAISTEETRYYLNGIYMHIVSEGKKNSLRAVATDGHRLAQADIAAPNGSKQMPGVIVPRKTVTEAANLLEGADGDISVSVSQTKIKIETERTTIVSKLIDGTFPDYGRVVPLANNNILKVDKSELETAVDRVSTVSSERGRAVKLALAPGKLVMTVNNPDQGNAIEELDVDYDGAPLEIGFNSKYLQDIASQLPASSMAVLAFQDPGSPSLIRQEGDDTALFVLMPMRV